MRLPLTLIASLALSGCASMSVNELRATFHTVNAVDVGTTVYGMDHGFHEGNPIASNMPPGGIILLGGLESLAAEFVCGTIAADEGQEKPCWIAFTWVKALTAGWNVYQLASH